MMETSPAGSRVLDRVRAMLQEHKTRTQPGSSQTAPVEESQDTPQNVVEMVRGVKSLRPEGVTTTSNPDVLKIGVEISQKDKVFATITKDVDYTVKTALEHLKAGDQEGFTAFEAMTEIFSTYVESLSYSNETDRLFLSEVVKKLQAIQSTLLAFERTEQVSLTMEKNLGNNVVYQYDVFMSLAEIQIAVENKMAQAKEHDIAQYKAKIDIINKFEAEFITMCSTNIEAAKQIYGELIELYNQCLDSLNVQDPTGRWLIEGLGGRILSSRNKLVKLEKTLSETNSSTVFSDEDFFLPLADIDQRRVSKLQAMTPPRSGLNYLDTLWTTQLKRGFSQGQLKRDPQGVINRLVTDVPPEEPNA